MTTIERVALCNACGARVPVGSLDVIEQAVYGDVDGSRERVGARLLEHGVVVHECGGVAGEGRSGDTDDLAASTA